MLNSKNNFIVTGAWFKIIFFHFIQQVVDPSLGAFMRSLTSRSQLNEAALMDMLVREISLGPEQTTENKLGKRKKSIGAIPALGSGATITCEEMR
jgi:hypothetical protein